MQEVSSQPVRPGRPMQFSVLRVPFFLEPDYDTDERFEETNRERLIRKWGGEAGFEAQKRRHGLKERGREVGIEHFNLDRIASSTLASHRLVQWVTKQRGVTAAETLCAPRHRTRQARAPACSPGAAFCGSLLRPPDARTRIPHRPARRLAPQASVRRWQPRQLEPFHSKSCCAARVCGA